jgi:hypothetical protein
LIAVYDLRKDEEFHYSNTNENMHLVQPGTSNCGFVVYIAG